MTGAGAISGDERAERFEPDVEGPEPVDDGIAVGVPTVAAGTHDTLVPDAESLIAERDEYLGALQRLQADFENYRKRVVRQQEEQSARAARDLVGKILPVIDTLDLAQAHLTGNSASAGNSAGSAGNGGGPGTGPGDEATPGDAGTGPARTGETGHAGALEQARSQLLDVLVKEGLERVDLVGVAFDPSIHDAVAHAPADGGDGTDATTVDEVLRAGYRWRGHVLRPAMVRVRG
jgi:molecular chaperone GrpE